MDEKFSITEVDSDKYINVNLSISPEFIKIRNQNDTQSYTLSMLTVISFPFFINNINQKKKFIFYINSLFI